MKTKHWNSNIITFQDDNSFSLVSANKYTGWLLTLWYFFLTGALILAFILIKWFYFSAFTSATPFFLVILFFLLNSLISSIPVGTDCFLYLTDKKFRYQFYHLGYTEIIHPLRKIHKISLSSNNRCLQFHLYNKRVIERIDLPINSLNEATKILQEVYTFLERQGVVLSPLVIIPPKK